MITIYGRANSSNVQLVMWALGELGLAHERLDYGGPYGKLDTPEYGVLNPNRLVPVMQDGDFVMFESAAILRYLAASYGSEEFWPRDPRVRGALDQWAEWSKNTFTGAMTPIFVGYVRVPAARYDPGATGKYEPAVARLARILDDRLGAGPWLAGAAFTFADIAVGYYLYRYYTLPMSRPETPNLDAYYARLQERPAYRQHAMYSYESLRAKE